MTKLFKSVIYVSQQSPRNSKNELTVMVYVIANFNLANYLPTMQLVSLALKQSAGKSAGQRSYDLVLDHYQLRVNDGLFAAWDLHFFRKCELHDTGHGKPPPDVRFEELDPNERDYLYVYSRGQFYYSAGDRRLYAPVVLDQPHGSADSSNPRYEWRLPRLLPVPGMSTLRTGLSADICPNRPTNPDQPFIPANWLQGGNSISKWGRRRTQLFTPKFSVREPTSGCWGTRLSTIHVPLRLHSVKPISLVSTATTRTQRSVAQLQWCSPIPVCSRPDS
jgi:hypothetical protein